MASAHETPASSSTPVSVTGNATVSRRAANRLEAGHVWVYRSDVMAVEPEDAPAGLMTVLDPAGHFLGTALWSPASEISLRIVSEEELTAGSWLEQLRIRIREALTRRESLLDEKTDSCRLVFAEADALPGLVVDRYAGITVFQLLAAAMDHPTVRATVIEELAANVSGLQTIVERPDPRIRELEALPAPALGALWSAGDTPRTATEFRLNGLRFHFDADAGQKTGAFLDQRLNYALAARHGHGEALDICTYQGGFALHLATTCRSVTGVDVSQAALDVAARNLELNRETLGGIDVDWVKADAFALLREWSDAGSEFDTIVLDPPAFAKSRRAAENAMRGYKEMNLRALKMLRPGGTLVTCSCSHHVPLEEFQAVVAAAAGDAGRRVRLIERTGAAPDHPVILTIPETEYLKCLVLEVE